MVSTETTFTPVADSYVDSSQASSNFGTNTALRVDSSPTIRTYLKFTLSGLTGTVNQATLRVFATSAQSTGYDVFAVSDTSWIESGAGSLNFNNAPPLAATKTGSSGPVFAGTWTTVNVTPLVSGNGTITIALTTTNTIALAMQSRTGGTNPPQLDSHNELRRRPSPVTSYEANRKQKLVAGFIAPLFILAVALFVVDTSPGGEGHSGRAASATYATSRLPVSARILGMGRVGEVLVGALKGPKPKAPTDARLSVAGMRLEGRRLRRPRLRTSSALSRTCCRSRRDPPRAGDDHDTRTNTNGGISGDRGYRGGR